MLLIRSLVVLVLFAGVAPAEDWAQWLGPRRDNSTVEKIEPWKDPPKVLWRVPVGDGHSSPIIAGGKVFLHHLKGGTTEEIAAYDAGTGKPAWSESYERAKFSSIFGNGPRSTPLVHDGKVYTLGVTGVLACWDAASGKKVWMIDTAKEFNPPALTFGVSCSPLIEGDKLLVNVGAKGASVVAFDRKEGTVAWKSQDDRASYSSPIAIGEGRLRQIVFLTQKGVSSFNPTDGSLNWQVPLVDLLNESSTTPVKVGDMLLASSVTFGSLGLQLKDNQNKPAAEQKWKNPGLTCYFSTPVAVGPHVYLVSGSFLPPPKANLHCVDVQTGKVLWKKESVGKYHAALVRTANEKLLMLDDNGFLTLLEPNAKEYRELARAKVCSPPCWAHPAVSNGRVYLRDAKELICVQLPLGK